MVSHNQLIVVGRWWWLVLCAFVALQMSVLMSFEEPIHSLNSVQFSSVQLLLLLLHISSGIISLSQRREKRIFGEWDLKSTHPGKKNSSHTFEH
jgi:hypothetical protein